MKRIFVVICGLLILSQSYGQEKLSLSGNIEANANFFLRDSLIGAANTPQYEHQIFGGEAWLMLNAQYQGFEAGVRFDMFNNSNLLNPTGSYTDDGIGRWYIKKRVGDLEVEGGYLYDQIGSGIIFRSYEARSLMIDNALFGVKARYDFSPNLMVKAFMGRQKNLFERYESNLKGFNVEGYIKLDSTARFSILPGAGVVGKTLSDNYVNGLVNTIKTYTPADSIGVRYNTYSFTGYNTLIAGPVTWYFEGAYKTKDDMFDPLASRTNWDGSSSLGKYIQRDGHVLFSTLSYASKGFGINVQAKRTKNFRSRAEPGVILNRGFVNFLPPMSRQNTYRLTARYQPAAQEFGEMGIQADAAYKFNKRWAALVNFSHISDLNEEILYSEVFTQVTYKEGRDWKATVGVQSQVYNQKIYEIKPNVPLVKTITPYVEYLRKMKKSMSIRAEAQGLFMLRPDGDEVRQDYGNWLFGLAEFNLDRHWTFVASDMYNVSPGKNSPYKENSLTDQLSIHYPRIDVFYTKNSTRMGLSYVKQVEGVVCTGGVCRLEPAFSGVKFSVNSTF